MIILLFYCIYCTLYYIKTLLTAGLGGKTQMRTKVLAVKGTFGSRPVD